MENPPPEVGGTVTLHRGFQLSARQVPQGSHFVRAELESAEGTIYTQPSIFGRGRLRDDRDPMLALCMFHCDIDTMFKSITIRDVPEETRDELAARAARSGRSLQEYLRGRLIEFAARPDPEDWLQRVRERKRATGTRLSGDRILAHRDADRK